MPANLTPDYHRAEARFRSAKSVEERIDALEEMLRVGTNTSPPPVRNDRGFGPT